MKYLIVRNHLRDYIRETYQADDLRMDTVHEDFIRGFCYYLCHDKGLSQSTAWLYQIPLKHLFTRAFNEGWISRNPFTGYHIRPIVKMRLALSERELRKMVQIQLSNPGLAFARDMFIFSCYTGISFVDLKNLTVDHIVRSQGSTRIVGQRKKTGTLYRIKLMKMAMDILTKYEKERTGTHVFPIGSYTVMSARLKELSTLCKFPVPLTYHVSRHTFATLALSNGVPIESISAMLGHASISTTQIYARLTEVKLSRDIDALERTLTHSRSGSRKKSK